MLKRILVIDDNMQHRTVEEFKNKEIQVNHVTSVREALEAFLTGDYVLVILDAGISECDGYRLLEVMQAARPTPVLMLSPRNNQNFADERGTVSSDGNHDKWDCSRDSLALAQKVVCSGEVCKIDTNHQYSLVCGQNLIITPARREVLLNGEPVKLTKTEFDLLFCLASHPGQVLSREQLYDYVWGEDSAFNVDDVVKAHIKSIRKKLASAKVEYIHNVWGIGYSFQANGDSE